MECFTVLLAVCTSLSRPRAEELLLAPLYFPATCLSEGTSKPLLQGLTPALSPLLLWNAVEQALRVTAVVPRLAERLEASVCSTPLRLPPRPGAVAVERTLALAPVQLVGSVLAVGAADSQPRSVRTPSPLTARCLGQRCTLTWLERGSAEPLFELEGSRSTSGEMAGSLKAGRWLRATGRLVLDRGSHMVVHVQDVDLGETDVRAGRLSIGGIERSTFRYFDTADAKGISVASEVGPVLGFHLPSSSQVVSLILTAGPEVLFSGAVSGTMHLGMTYSR